MPLLALPTSPDAINFPMPAPALCALTPESSFSMLAFAPLREGMSVR